MSTLLQSQVHALETEIVDLAVKLSSARDFAREVTRDDLGTLHVNVCGLMRRADALAKRLEQVHGFLRGK